MSSPDLIDDLVEDLAPVERASAVGTSALLWTGVSVAVVMGVVWATGPLRPGWVDQLWASPRFVLENLSGLLFAAAAMAAAFALATPGAVKREQALGVVALAWAAWVALLLYGVADPALAPSMEGKRPYCVQEIWVWSVPPLLGAIALLRRRAAFDRRWVVALSALAASALPAVAMQVACMYDPSHALKFHLAPMIPVALVGMALGRRALPRV